MDIKTIPGYKDGMTAEEQLALLKDFTPEADHTGWVKKDLLDKAAKEAADAKRELKSRLTEDEQKEAERAAEQAQKDARLADLEKRIAVSDNKVHYLELGYDEKLAADTAAALADGDMAKVFANQKLHIENVKKAERAAALATGGEPPAGKNKPEKGERDKLIAQYNEAEKKGDTTAMFMLEAKIKALPKE